MKDLDNNLLLRIKKGDREAFDMLFEDHFEALCNCAFLIVRDESTAEEIVAEVFYRLWFKRNKINIRVSLKKYLFKSVYNVSMNYLKHIGIVKRYKDLSIVMHKEKEIFSGDYSTSPLAILEYNELESLVNEGIDNLPDQCKKVFTMNRFKGMKYHEIAESLNISLSTVKYHMSTA
jgi:RNA polymerase sigma-70 factor (ECF subfamily)